MLSCNTDQYLKKKGCYVSERHTKQEKRSQTGFVSNKVEAPIFYLFSYLCAHTIELNGYAQKLPEKEAVAGLQTLT
jgi:hypothetical protein